MEALTKDIIDFVINQVKAARERILNDARFDDEMQFLQGKIAAYDEILELVKKHKENN